ncbi:MAG TPA: TetR/AcrR family transcriptional regulator [Actinocatenispora sp.]
MPTGVAMHDARAQLFDAAERVLLRAGPVALTSRAVTTEAGCAKGVLHRHFADFDAFLVDLVLDRTAPIRQRSVALREAAGTGTVVDTLTDTLPELFDPMTLALIRLVLLRDELRDRLRQVTSVRIPVVMDVTAMIAGYLTAERDLGRVAADADIGTLAPTLIGAAHLLFTDREAGPPERPALRRVVVTVLASALPDSTR